MAQTLKNQPVFLVEYCFNCKEHAWCTRHDEKKYKSMAD